MRQGLVAAALCGALCEGATAGGFIPQLNYFATGFDGSGPLLIPAIDPAGVGYHHPSGHLFIADAEIEEVPEAFAIVGANIFEVSPAGDVLYTSYDLTALGNDEPTGIAYNQFDGFFYVSNDDDLTITRYAFSAGSGFGLDDEVDTVDSAGVEDPEGIDCDPDTGLIYLLDGHGALIAVYDYVEGIGFQVLEVLDLADLNDADDVPSDPEGIAFDPCTGHLFLVSTLDEALYEYTTGGLFVARYDLSTLTPAVISPQGLTVGPTSDPADDPLAVSIYFADGGIDNNNDPDERDGAVYEADLECLGGFNVPPALDPVPDQTLDEETLLALFITASDPNPGDVLTFSLVASVPAGASIDPVTGLFTWMPSEEQGPGDYQVSVRVTDDGFPPALDETSFMVTVNEVNDPPVLDPIANQNVDEGTTLSVPATASDPNPGDILTFSLVASVPAGASIDPVTGLFSWTPSEAQGPGNYEVTVRVTDDWLPPAFDETSFIVTVNEVNDPPVLDPIANQKVNEGTQLSVPATASDPNPGDVLTFSLVASVPAGASIDPLTGLFTWTPSEAQGPENYQVTVRVTDDGLPPAFDETSFMVTVHQVDTPANDPPALDPIGNRTVPVNEVLTFTATATDPDVNTGPSGLVAHWPFDADLSSTTGSHHGTAAGNAAITGAPGQTILGGGALSLDGAGDYVNVGDIPLPGDLAVAAWTFPLNIDAGSDSKAVVVGDSDGDDFIRIQAADVRARFNGSTTSLTTNPDFVNGSWQHMALVRSGASITVYRNGQVVATGSSAQPFTPEFIGRKGGDYFGGLLDDVSVWDRALDPDEVAFLYGGGLGNPANALGSAGSGLTFSLLGDVPPGATIDGITGAFTWTAPPMPASYTFIVRVSDNGVPPLSDEEEITVTAFVPCSAADLDGDGAVGVVDFLMLLQTWGTDPGGPPDLDGNGNVGITDMLLLLGSWGPCA